MVESKIGFDPLAVLSIEQLQRMWDIADNTPGERVRGFTKGAISLKIAERVVVRSERMLPILRLRRRIFHHPIDGSWWMVEQNRRGAIMARSRR